LGGEIIWEEVYGRCQELCRVLAVTCLPIRRLCLGYKGLQG
jgi:hypothetical protein